MHISSYQKMEIKSMGDIANHHENGKILKTLTELLAGGSVKCYSHFEKHVDSF